jgi:putative serine protease PepD
VLAGAAGGGIVAAVDRGNNTTSAVPASVTRNVSALATTATSSTPEAAAAVIGPSVVTVEVTGTAVATSPFGSQSQQVSGTGSGIVIRVDGTTGYILTNNHVVSAAVSGGSVHITTNDGRTVAATIVGNDTTSDLAVVKVTGVTGLKAATFADSDALKVGQAVLAIGAPLGLSNTVTQGIVSTLHRPVTTGESGAGAQAVLDAVQTDAAINPGNSGGALVDLAGRVVGINSAIASTGSSGTSQAGNIGVGFAIPSNDAADVADQLIATGHATHAQIGISAQDAASNTNGAPGLGATIGAVSAGGPAAKAGLQPGDLITKVGDRVVTDADSLIVAVRANAPGTTVTVTYTRGGQTHTTPVTLAASAAS